jgi:leucyl-tRNA synthetase
LISVKEPTKKLINQGMITGISQTAIIDKVSKEFISNDIATDFNQNLNYYSINVEISLVDNQGKLNIEDFLKWRPEYSDYKFRMNKEDEFICGTLVEKMSKSKYNVVTPDDIIEDYGADTLRLYEMFLGPLEQSKPWSTQGIEGVHRFLKKLWRLFYNDNALLVNNDEPSKQELKALHKLIKKVGEDIENFSFNTSVPAFMICVNELSDLKCNKSAILSDFLVCLSSYAPHITEELWQNALSNLSSIVTARFPFFNPEYLVESSFSYPISINGKHRENIEFPLDANPADVEAMVLANETVQKWLEGKTPKKVIFVKGKIVNIVV